MPRTVTRELADAAVALERGVSWIRRTLRPTEWSAIALSTLDAVDRSGPLRITDLTARERITQPGMTGLVARLEAAGLVRRTGDPSDGRATLVAITPAGRNYLRDLRARRAAVLAEHLHDLPPEHQQAIIAAAPALEALAARPVQHEGV